MTILFFQILQAVPDVPPDFGGEAFGGLIQKKKLGVGHQGPSNGQHLLLAAG
jgi:hypothetical protein